MKSSSGKSSCGCCGCGTVKTKHHDTSSPSKMKWGSSASGQSKPKFNFVKKKY